MSALLAFNFLTSPVQSQVLRNEPSLEIAVDFSLPTPVQAKSLPKPDFDSEVLAPLRQIQEEKRKAEEARLEALRAAEEATRIATAQQAYLARQRASYRPVYTSYAPRYGLSGSYGYALPYGNCVDEPGLNNPGYGNPISWPVTSYSPWIGATALWTYNHTGVVTGIWSNGDIEVRHRNFQGGITRFPRSAFRGFR